MHLSPLYRIVHEKLLWLLWIASSLFNWCCFSSADDGELFMDGCNMCTCFSGELVCTMKHCPEPVFSPEYNASKYRAHKPELLFMPWVSRRLMVVNSSPHRAIRVRALAGDIVLCSWAKHFTLTVPLSTQVYKWVPANLMLGGNPAMD